MKTTALLAAMVLTAAVICACEGGIIPTKDEETTLYKNSRGYIIPFTASDPAAEGAKVTDLRNLYHTLYNEFIPMLYVMLPDKASSFEPAKAYDITALENLFAAEFVDTLDLRDIFTGSPEDYFYKNNSAFNCDGSLEITRRIIERSIEYYSIMLGDDLPAFDNGYYISGVVESGAPNDYGAGDEEDYRYLEPTGNLIEYSVRYYGGSEKSSSKTGRFDEVVFGYRDLKDNIAAYNENIEPEGSSEAFGSANDANTPAKPAANDYILSNSAAKITLSSKNARRGSENLLVIHNLNDLSILAMLADNFNRVVAIDVRNISTSETVISLVREENNADLCITLLDPTGNWPEFNRGDDIKNNVIPNAEIPLKDNNRFLQVIYDETDVTLNISNMLKFKEKLDELDCELLYVQTPFKVLEGYTILPEGVHDYANLNADKFLDGIRTGDVPTIDLRETVQQELDPSQIFYKTDHHWRAESGFWGYTKIIDYIKNTLGWDDVDPGGKLTDPENYVFDTAEHFFYAHHAQAYPRSFVGADSFTLIYPAFETKMRMTINRNGRFTTTSGSFYDTIFAKNYLDPENKDANRYAAYLFGDTPLETITTEGAPSDKRVLVVKCSFANALNPFLALNFEEFNIIDIRHYKLATLTEFVEKGDFDLVIFVYNPNLYGTNDHMFYFG